MKRWKATAGAFLLGGGLVVALVAVGAVVWLRTPAGNARLLSTLLGLAAPARGTLTVGSLTTNVLGDLRLEGIDLIDVDGTVLAHIEEVHLEYDLGGLFGRKLVVHDASITGVEVHLRNPDGTCRNPIALWDSAPGTGGGWKGIGLNIELQALTVSVDTVELCSGKEPLTGSVLTLTGDARLDGAKVSSTGLHFEGVLGGPSWVKEPSAFGLDVVGDWDGRSAHIEPADAFLGLQHARVTAELAGLDGPAPTGAAEILAAHFEPEPFGIAGVHGPFDATGTIKGALAHPVADLKLETHGGIALVKGDVDIHGAVPLWNADVQLPEEVQLSGTIEALRDTRVAGRVTVAGQGFGWPDNLHIDGTADLTASTVEGAGPYRIAGPVTLDHGRVDAPMLHVESPAGVGELTVHVDVPAGGLTIGVIDTDIDLARLSAYGVPGLRGRVHYTGSIAGDWIGGFRASAEGAIRGGAVGYRDQVQVATVAGPARVRWDVDHGAIAARLHTSGLEIPPGAKPVVSGATGDVIVSLDIGRGGVEGRLDATIQDVTVPTQHYDLVVANALLAHDSVTFAGIGGTAVAEGSETGLPETEALSAEGRYQFNGTLSLDQARINPAPGVDWKLTEPATVLITDDRFVLHANAASSDGNGSVVADGTLRTRGDCDLDLALTHFTLATVSAFLPGEPLAGVIDGTAHISGPLRAPVTQFEAHGAELVIPGALLSGDLTLEGSSDGQSVTVDARLRRMEGLSPLLTLHALVGLRPDGDLPALDPDAPLTLTLRVPPSSSEEWRSTLAPELLAPTLPEFRAAAEIALAGTINAPRASVTLGAQLRARDGWVTVDADATVVDELATVRVVANQQLTRRAEASGTLGVALASITRMALGEPAPDPLTLASNLSLDLVPLQLPLAALGAPSSVQGSLLGGLHVSGDPRRPNVEGALMVINGVLGDVPVSPAMLTLTGTESGYDIDAQLAFGGGGGVRARGFVPVQANFGALDSELARTGLNLVVDGEGIPLKAASALIPGLSEASGLARITGTIGGQVSAPQPDLTLSVQNGAFTVDPLNVRYATVNLNAHLTADAFVIENIEAITSARSHDLNVQRTGTLHAAGRIALDRFAPGAIQGALDLDNAWVANRKDVSLRATSSLRLSGSWPLLAISGRVDVDDANIVLAESFFSSESALKLDPDILVFRSGVTAPKVVQPTVGLDLDLDVQIFLNRHADVDVTIPMEQFGGELTKSLSNLRFDVVLDSPDGLRLQRRRGVVQVAGVVEPLSGFANVLGKNFELAGGTISFTGVDYLTPLLNLSATYASSADGNITAHITGPAQTPTISFSSDQGKSLDDMISILLFGAPVNALQDQSSAAIQAAFKSIFRSQMNEATSLTRLDVLELSSENYTFGKRFGKDVLVEVAINPNANASTTLVNPVELKIQVPLWKGWYLEGSAGTAGLGAVSAYKRWRF